MEVLSDNGLQQQAHLVPAKGPELALVIACDGVSPTTCNALDAPFAERFHWPWHNFIPAQAAANSQVMTQPSVEKNRTSDAGIEMRSPSRSSA